MIEPIYVYGIYQGKTCIYVGITVHPKRRLSLHRVQGKLAKLEIEMRVFRKVEACRSALIESQVIRAFQCRGLARLNERLFMPYSLTMGRATPVRCLETGMVFRSKQQAGRFFDISAQAIAKATDCEHGIGVGGRDYHFTAKL